MVTRLDGARGSAAGPSASPSVAGVPGGAVDPGTWPRAASRCHGSRHVVGWTTARKDYLIGVAWAQDGAVVALLEWTGFKQLGGASGGATAARCPATCSCTISRRSARAPPPETESTQAPMLHPATELRFID